MIEAFLERCLLLDLETGPPARGAESEAGPPLRIFKIGAILDRPGDRYAGPRARVLERRGRFRLDRALEELDRLARDADYVLGHNLLGHDLRVLEALAPGHPVLVKPVVDTLYLSPLAFPENPYHHLVKDYKLVRQAVNDPLADARLAARVFRDQWASFSHMESVTLAFYAFCLAALDGRGDSPGLLGSADVLDTVAGRPAMDVDEARAFLAETFAGPGADRDARVCRPALHRQAAGLADPARRPSWAYAAAWLRVAGGSSALPPWVRRRHPETVAILDALREIPCDGEGCAYCRRNHHPETQLRRFFGFKAFRPAPAAPDGGSLQRQVTLRGLAGRPLLAILATGAGKSICYQLPALVRTLRRGLLTVVISPLQALMKDQVDNLNALTGTDAAAALYGLLTPPERGVVLERVRLGDVAILYVAPEQLRNRSFLRTVEQREIAGWVFDEAHCLSKWGHDFRPDYLYAARFIRDLARRQGVPPPAVACFTATAKEDVKSEIVDHFRQLLGQELEVFEGAVEREELRFRVEDTRPAEKLPRLHALLTHRLAEPDGGSAVVYFASRRGCADAARYLRRRGLEAEAFHAGLKTPEKRQVLDDFLSGTLPVVCATNAFGMGIDKNDVHLVVHADIPGSLESYLQEAGRAGRDRRASDCVLLFDQRAVEHQFKLAASSHLSRRDLAQILRGLRRAARRSGPESEPVVALTSGEILRDEEVRTSFARDDWGADTKVKTAVAWLERGGFVERGHNQTRVFQGRLKVGSLEEARGRLARLAPRLRLSAAERRRWLAILKALLNADPDEGLTADELAEIPDVAWSDGSAAAGLPVTEGETPAQRVLRILHSMAETGLLTSGLRLTAWLRPRGPAHAAAAYETLCRLDRALLELLAETEPDADDGGWLELSLRLLNQRLVDRGHRSNPAVLQKLLRSLSEDGKGLAGRRGSLELKFRSKNRYRVRVGRSWRALKELAGRRRALGKVVLAALLERSAAADGAAGGGSSGGKVLVEFGLEDLTAAIRRDLALRGQVRDRLAAVERGLLFLHEQKIIQLHNGLAVFRQAMTLSILPSARGRRYTRGDYQPLDHHYCERTFQIHVMARYARLGTEKIQHALGLVHDYFQLGKESFVSRYFTGEEELLARATGQESYRQIVEALGNRRQIALVTAPIDRNLLVLAGPGSGKTRVVVHRCAYLLRVARVPARRILVLCFNRNAALELRRRLRALAGDDARGVTVQTYHGLAMRLTGTSFATLAERSEAAAEIRPDFDALIRDAIELLESGGELPGLEPDELQERILAGYSHLLVDEYQDINADQYRLVSALAGRRQRDRERRLAILAVGDDDQNIYRFAGADVAFIRRFREDYSAEVHYLVESYRSTAHILAAANSVIAKNRERMKGGRPIAVDNRRREDDPGGRWAALEPAAAGRVHLLRLADAGTQAVAVGERLRRMKELDPELRWSDCAVLARRHAVLEPIRAVLEDLGIPLSWASPRDQLPTLYRIREIAALLATLRQRRREILRASRIEELYGAHRWPAGNPWRSLASELLAEWRRETGDGELAVQALYEFLCEALVERRRQPALGDGVRLATVHAAKGLEFRHLFLADGGWEVDAPAGLEEERRLYYVGMTRARETLHLLARHDAQNPHLRDLEGDFLERREPSVEPPAEAVAGRRFALLGLADLFLDYAGRQDGGAPIHRRLAALQPGDLLHLRRAGDFLHLVDRGGGAVAALSAAGRERWGGRRGSIEAIRVVAMVERRAEDSEEEYRRLLRCERWEVPVAEVVCRRSGAPDVGPRRSVDGGSRSG